MPYTRSKLPIALTLAPLLALTTLVLPAQDYGHRDDHHDRDRYYQGMRDGGRGGDYDRNPHENYRDDHDARYHQPGGIGPGKGAAIGGAAGALLGAAFGGGLKGAVIGGAAGAGVGAIAGQAHQDHRRDDY